MQIIVRRFPMLTLELMSAGRLVLHPMFHMASMELLASSLNVKSLAP